MIFVFLLALVLAVVIGIFVVKTVIGLALMLLLAGAIGAGVQSMLGYRGGFLFSIAAGLIGAVVGTVIANVLGAPKLLTLFNLPLLWTLIGSAAVVAVAKVARPQGGSARLGRGDRSLLR